MRNFTVVTSLFFLFTMVLSSCEGTDYEQDTDYFINPIDSIGSYFAQAEKIAGPGASLYLITGVQSDKRPSLKCNMNWKFYFRKDNWDITFELVKGKTVISVDYIQGPMMICEFINKNDDRLKSLLSPKIVWDSCINTYRTPILFVQLYATTSSVKKSNLKYNFLSNEGNNHIGIGLFVYDAKSGADLTKMN